MKNRRKARSKQEYKAQKFGAQYAWSRPRCIGNNLPIKFLSCPFTINGKNAMIRILAQL